MRQKRKKDGELKAKKWIKICFCVWSNTCLTFVSKRKKYCSFYFRASNSTSLIGSHLWSVVEQAQNKNRFHAAVLLFSYRSQMTSKCGKNVNDTWLRLVCLLFVLTTFWRHLSLDNMESVTSYFGWVLTMSRAKFPKTSNRFWILSFRLLHLWIPIDLKKGWQMKSRLRT